MSKPRIDVMFTSPRMGMFGRDGFINARASASEGRVMEVFIMFLLAEEALLGVVLVLAVFFNE